MASSCRRPVCDETCVSRSSRGRRPRWRRLARTLLVMLAVPAAACLVLLTGLGGPRRSAQQRRVRAVGRGSALILAALGVRTTTFGSAPRGGLVVGNHISWLDILVLSAAAPAREVAKAEIGTWPLIGGLARRAGSIFVRRDRWSELPAVVDQVASALRQGERVVVFPESTTRCGGSVGTFHRAMFQAAVDAAAPVAPVALAYRDSSGLPTTEPAFVGDEGLSASLRRVLAMDGVTAEVHWLPAVPRVAHGGHRSRDRAVIAALAQRAITVRLGVPVAGSATHSAGPELEGIEAGAPAPAPQPAPSARAARVRA